MPAQLYSCETILYGLTQDLKRMAAELGPFNQEEHTVMRERHLTQYRHVAPADQPRIRDRKMRGAARAGRDQPRAVAGEARDAVDARGLDGFSEGHRRQDGGESACQYPGADPTLWGWAPFHLSSDSKQRGAAPGTPDVMGLISTEESGECAFVSSLEVDFTGGDITVT
jgi:hypothetical protein